MTYRQNANGDDLYDELYGLELYKKDSNDNEFYARYKLGGVKFARNRKGFEYYPRDANQNEIVADRYREQEILKVIKAYYPLRNRGEYYLRDKNGTEYYAQSTEVGDEYAQDAQGNEFYAKEDGAEKYAVRKPRSWYAVSSKREIYAKDADDNDHYVRIDGREIYAFDANTKRYHYARRDAATNEFYATVTLEDGTSEQVPPPSGVGYARTSREIYPVNRFNAEYCLRGLYARDENSQPYYPADSEGNVLILCHNGAPLFIEAAVPFAEIVCFGNDMYLKTSEKAGRIPKELNVNARRPQSVSATPTSARASSGWPTLALVPPLLVGTAFGAAAATAANKKR